MTPSDDLLYGKERLDGLPAGSYVYVTPYLSTADLLWHGGAPAVSGGGSWSQASSRALAGHHAVLLTELETTLGPVHQQARSIRRFAASCKICPPCPSADPAGAPTTLDDFIRVRGVPELLHLALEVEGVGPPDPPADGRVQRSTIARSPVPFPFDALPSQLAVLAQAAEAAFGYPGDFLAVPGLAVLAAAIGGKVELELMPGAVARSVLYTAVIAPTSTGKGPAQDLATAPLVELSGEWFQAGQDRALAYETDVTDHARLRKEAGVTAAKRGKSGPSSTDAAEAPAPPHLPGPVRRCLFTDATIEGLRTPLAENPAGGALWVSNELSQILGGLDQYHSGGRGAGRSKFLELHDAPAGVVIDRVGGGTSWIPSPRVSVSGGLVPSNIRMLLEPDDGLGPRFLCSYHPGAGLALIDLECSLPPAVLEDWRTLVRARVGVPEVSEAIDWRGGRVKVRLSPGAMAKWKRAGGWLRERSQAPDTTEFGQKLLGKGQLQLGRLVLVLHCANTPGPPSLLVEGETVERALRLLKYFVGQADLIEPERASPAANLAVRYLDEGIIPLVAYLRRRPQGFALRGDLLDSNVAGVKTAEELDLLLGRYEDRYPRHVAEGHRPGVTTGRIGVVVYAPGAAPLAGETPLSGSSGLSGGESAPGGSAEPAGSQNLSSPQPIPGTFP
ncbi:MAG: DUF3987 domain-containing protein [Acidimicrobiales bacterium]